RGQIRRRLRAAAAPSWARGRPPGLARRRQLAATVLAGDRGDQAVDDGRIELCAALMDDVLEGARGTRAATVGPIRRDRDECIAHRDHPTGERNRLAAEA